jgi:hypothetical protein
MNGIPNDPGEGVSSEEEEEMFPRTQKNQKYL